MATNDETSVDFRVSPEGLHLLRNRFNYETIPFHQITDLQVKRTKVLNNWVIVLVIGICCLVFAVLSTIVLAIVAHPDKAGSMFMVPVLPFFFGLYMVVQSLKNDNMLLVTYRKKRKKLLLHTQQYEQLQQYRNQMNLVNQKENFPSDLESFLFQ